MASYLPGKIFAIDLHSQALPAHRWIAWVGFPLEFKQIYLPVEQTFPPVDGAENQTTTLIGSLVSCYWLEFVFCTQVLSQTDIIIFFHNLQLVNKPDSMLYRSCTFLLIFCLAVLSITEQKKAAVSSCGYGWVWFFLWFWQFSLRCSVVLSDGSTFGTLTSSWTFYHCERFLIPSDNIPLASVSQSGLVVIGLQFFWACLLSMLFLL